MSEIIQKVGDKHGVIYRIVLFVLTVAILVALFPQEAKFKYQYDHGRPWAYDDLVSPFEFAIKKSEGELLADRNKVLARVYPYYFRDDDVYDQQLKEFSNLITENWDDCSYKSEEGFLNFRKNKKDSIAWERHYSEGKKLLKKVFKNGIIKLGQKLSRQPF